MNSLQLAAREWRERSQRARPRALIVVGVLLLGVACGSSQGSAGPAGGSAANAAGNGAATGGEAGSDIAGHSGGPGAGTGGANSGSAGANGGNGGASAGNGGASVGAAGSGGRVDAGAGGTSGGATAGGGDGVQLLTCPANPPRPSESCTGGRVCMYEDCAGAGRTLATCGNFGSARTTWGVQTAPCGAVHCAGLPNQMSCTSGQICAVSEGGTIAGTCASSACGSGPVTCACAHAACTDCLISGSAEQGFTVTCNSCPQGGCP
jgi:hypothetical protein